MSKNFPATDLWSVERSRFYSVDHVIAKNALRKYSASTKGLIPHPTIIKCIPVKLPVQNKLT